MGILAKDCVNFIKIETNFQELGKIDFKKRFHPESLQLISGELGYDLITTAQDISANHALHLRPSQSTQRGLSPEPRPWNSRSTSKSFPDIR
jgi:hypothetical protein